ncbi:molecular chaperone DnaJ [Salmonella enterica subsp. enterica]|nr:molecular chaperone DnaJ [Salmonella enterica subsp. enterica serovar Oranienburg]HAF4747114.1 molecular chaperone DnaJ [Salmonella enterica]
MTTITKEEVKAFIEQIESDLANGWEAQIFELKLARIALASLDAEPVGEVSEKRHGLVMDGTVDLGGKSTYRIIKGEKAMKRLPLGTKFYIALPAPVVDADPVVFTDERNLHHIARGRETSLIWGKQNQEVGDIPLYRHAQPAPVVPEEIPKGLAGQIVSLLAHNIGDKFLAQKIWNACRAAMLQGVEQPQNARQNIPENIPDGNSPAIPDGWVIVPKKLTAENGAKGVLSGEFSETTFISCTECFGDDDCDTCDGSGRIEIKVPVTWTTIKSIWDKGIAYFAAEPLQEVNRG